MHRQLIRQHQQAQQQAYDGQQRPAAAAAESSGPTPQQILADPSSTAEQRDEALARMLRVQAQFDEEGDWQAEGAGGRPHDQIKELLHVVASCRMMQTKERDSNAAKVERRPFGAAKRLAMAVIASPRQREILRPADPLIHPLPTSARAHIVRAVP